MGVRRGGGWGTAQASVTRGARPVPGPIESDATRRAGGGGGSEVHARSPVPSGWPAASARAWCSA